MGRWWLRGVLYAGGEGLGSGWAKSSKSRRDALELSEQRLGYEPESKKGGSGRNALRNATAMHERIALQPTELVGSGRWGLAPHREVGRCARIIGSTDWRRLSRTQCANRVWLSFRTARAGCEAPVGGGCWVRCENVGLDPLSSGQDPALAPGQDLHRFTPTRCAP